MEYKKMHFMIVFRRIVSFLSATIIPFLIFILFTQEEGTRNFLLVYTGFFLFVVVSSLLKWHYTSYHVTDKQFTVKSGWLHKEVVLYPVETIQGINLTSNFVYNWLKVVQLKIETAGTANGSSVDVLVKKEEAERIQQLIYPQQKEKVYEKEKQITFSELLIMSSTSMGLFIGLPIIYGLYTQLKDIFPEKMANLFKESPILNSYTHLMEGVNFERILWFLAFLALLLLVAWLIGTVHTLFKYTGFKLVREGDKINMEYGFFITKKITIPIHRIQALKVVEGMLRQPFGLASIKVESIGYGEESGGETVLMPLIKKKEIEQFFKDYIPEFREEQDLVAAPFQSFKYYLTRSTLSAIGMVFGLWYFVDYAYLLFWLLPFVFVLSFLRYKDAGILISDNMLYLRRRNLAKETIIIPNKSIQSVDVKQHFNQKKDGIAHYEISTASEQQNKSFVVKDIPVSEREYLMKWIFHSQKKEI